MPAQKPLKERIEEQRESVKEWMGYRDEAKRRLDNAESGEVKRRRAALEDIRKTLDEKRDRLIELKDERDDRRKKRRSQFHFTPGAPHWGGSDIVLRDRSEPYIRKQTGAEPNSAKRTETFGNPGSDHYVGQVWASARDWPLANRHDLRNGLASATAGRSISVADYEAFYFEVAGHEFRGQIIAANHGTGPHLHEGVELVG